MGVVLGTISHSATLMDTPSVEASLNLYTQPQGSLLAMMQPLITEISHLSSLHKGQDFDEVSNSYLKAFIERAPIAVAVLDLDFSIRYMSAPWVSWVKRHMNAPTMQPEALLGVDLRDIIHPFPSTMAQYLKAGARGHCRRSNLLEYEIKQTKYCIRWESFPWYTQKPQPTALIVFCEDITEHQEIVLLNQKLQETNDMLENFALIMSHDIIQPMRQINSYVELLKDHVSQDTAADPFVSQAFSGVATCLSQMRHLVEGIILYCREGNLTVEAHPVLVMPIVRQIKSSFLDQQSQHFHIAIPEDTVVQVNPVCVFQLFQNLLANAVKFAEPDRPDIRITCKRYGAFYEFQIHNYGHCASSHVRKKAFDPFQSSFVDGAGLGLAICKKIVTAYQGTISMQSCAKQGTCVTFTLPVAEEGPYWK